MTRLQYTMYEMTTILSIDDAIERSLIVLMNSVVMSRTVASARADDLEECRWVAFGFLRTYYFVKPFKSRGISVISVTKAG